MTMGGGDMANHTMDGVGGMMDHSMGEMAFPMRTIYYPAYNLTKGSIPKVVAYLKSLKRTTNSYAKITGILSKGLLGVVSIQDATSLPPVRWTGTLTNNYLVFIHLVWNVWISLTVSFTIIPALQPCFVVCNHVCLIC